MKIRKTKRPFTLLELLVVITIIVILMSMLMPALGRSREQAKRVACLSNQHQIGNAINIWAVNNERQLPKDGRSWSRPHFIADLFRRDWFDDVDLTQEIYKCPSTPFFGWDRNSSHGLRGKADARTSFFYLGNGHGTRATWERRWRERPQKLTDKSTDRFQINHAGFTPKLVDGAMQVFLDGHGEWRSDFRPLRWGHAGSNHDAGHAKKLAHWGHFWW
jgi:type II secretory pathway pseudopilin PulG